MPTVQTTEPQILRDTYRFFRVFLAVLRDGFVFLAVLREDFVFLAVPRKGFGLAPARATLAIGTGLSAWMKPNSSAMASLRSSG
jgi:hypothetical protein